MKNKLFYPNLFFCVVLAVLYFVYGAVLTPLYIKVCSDVIYLESFLPDIFEILLEFFQLLIWVHLFSNMLFSIKRKKLSGFFSISVILTFFRYFLPSIVTLVKGSALDPTGIFDALIYFGADMVMLFIVFVIVLFNRNKNGRKFLRFGAVVPAILLSVSKIAMRIIFDIFYGAPQSISEISIMIAYYFSDVLYGVIAFFLILFASKLLVKEKNSH